MRPVRLELSGFTAFREPTVVDFDGADLFALTGPTGAGKSSLIDAMTFALYGAVPRYDDRRLVAPVISQGKLEAKVRLDFTVDGTAHTAVRVVRRTASGGATTKEARLERGGSVIAGDAAAVTEAIEHLLGLAFEQFTTCVVLPQGDFARFLHETPARRQDLLVRLLDLGLYRSMREQANARATAAVARVDAADAQLAELASATPVARAEAAAAHEALVALRERMDDAKPRIDAIGEALAVARARGRDEQGRADRLAGLAVPSGVADLAERLRSAGVEREAAEMAVAATDAALVEAERARAALGDDAPLHAAARGHRDRPGLAEAVARAKEMASEAQRASAAQEEAGRVAAASLAAARDARDAARRAHAAADLAAHLEPGVSCPVCAQVVVAVPDAPRPASLDEADAAVARAEADAAASTRALGDAGGAKARAGAALDHARTQLAELDAALAEGPDAEEAERRLAAIAAADAAVTAARKEASAARTRAAATREAAGRLASAERDAWAAFEVARDAVAADGPPPVDRGDLAGAWDALVSWGQARAPAASAAARAATDEVTALEAERADLIAGFRADLVALGVTAGERQSPRDACADALSAAKAQVERIDTDLARAERLRVEREDQRRAAEVARGLAGHLSARGFERWLLDEALDALVVGASATLRELSGGAYSLAVDDARTFAVVDHHNADEPRSAKTLSGGETFLASLALALALADQLAEIGARGAARLEAIFLDEGFGTLDAETLDTVAAAIEELGAGGRTVGLVTHVRDLAERMPVRFEVRKDPTSAIVERVDA